MADSNFLISFNIDLTQAEASLKRFQKKSEAIVAKGLSAPVPKFSVPQIPPVPGFAATTSAQTIGANLAAAQAGIPVPPGTSPSDANRIRNQIFRGSADRANILAQYGLNDTNPEIVQAQKAATARITKLAQTMDIRLAAEEALVAITREQLTDETQIAALDEAISQLKAEEHALQVAENQRKRADQNLENKQQRLDDPDLQRKTANTKLAEAQQNREIALRDRLSAAEFNAREGVIRTKVQAQLIEARTNAQAAAMFAKEKASDEALLRAEAQRVVQEHQLAKLMKARIQQEARRSGLGFFESRQVANVGRSGGIGTTPGGFFGGGLASTLRYAVPSAALFGGVALTSNLVRESEELDRIFRQLEGQLENTAGVGQKAFAQLKETIFDTAKATGTAADELGQMAIRFQGAFGDQEFVNREGVAVVGQDIVDDAIDAAGKLSQITGLDAEELTNDLVAVSQAFQTIPTEVGDLAIQMERLFGVAPEEALNFLGGIAPVAAEAGFELEEIAAIGAEVLLVSNRGGAALAESWGRVIPALGQSKQQLIELGSQARAFGDDFVEAVASNDIPAVIFEIGENYKKLSGPQQDMVNRLVGGRREAQAIVAAFESGDLEAEMEALADGAGAMDQRFASVEETLSVQLSQAVQAFQQAFLAVFELGIEDLLEGLVDLLKLAAKILDPIASGFKAVDDALGGALGELIKIVALLKVIQVISRTQIGQNLAASVTGIGQNALFQAQAGTQTFAPAASFSQFGRNAGIQQATAQAGIRGAAARANYGLLPPGRLGGAGGVGGLFTRGGAQSASLGGQAAVLATGLIAVKSTFDEQSARVGQAAEEFGESLKSASDEELAKIAGTETTGFARLGISALSEGFLGGLTGEGLENLPEAQARKEEIRRQGERGAEILRNIIENGDAELLAERYKDFAADTPDGTSLARFVEDNFNYSDIESIGLDPLEGDVGQQLIDKLADPEEGEAFLESLTKLSDEGNRAAAVIVQHYGEVVAGSEEVGGIGQDVIDELERLERLGVAVEDIEQSSADLASLKTAFENGAITQAEYLQAYDLYINDLRTAVEESNGEDKVLLAKRAEAERAREEIIASGITEVTQLQQQLSELKYGDIGGNARATAAGLEDLEELRERGLGGTDASLEVALETIGARRAEVEEYIQQLAEDDPAAAAALLEQTEGKFEIPGEARLAILEAQLADINNNWQFLIKDFDSLIGGGADEMIHAILEFVLTGEGMNESQAAEKLEYLRGVLEEMEAYPGLFVDFTNDIRVVRAMIEALETGDLDALAEALDIDDVGGEFEVDPEIAEETAKENSKRLADAVQARYDLAIALAEGDSIKQAQLRLAAANAALAAVQQDPDATDADIINAQTAIVNAQNGIRQEMEANVDAQNNLIAAQISQDPLTQAAFAEAVARGKVARTIYGTTEYFDALTEWQNAVRAIEAAQEDAQDAQLELAAAQVAGDAIKSAEVAIQQANVALARAEGEAERARALAQQIEAQQAYEEAINDLWNAQNELLLAQANFVGDSIEAAQLGLQAAQYNLQQVQEAFAKGQASEADVVRAEAELINAQAAVRDATLQDKLGDYEFLYQMEQITKQQFIQYLQSLKQIPDLTEEQIRELDSKIKSLQDELASDLQFNLPSQLNIDGLFYQARRLNQSTTASGAPAGYQDNRTVTVNINVNNGADEARMVEVVNDALGAGGSRFGGGRRY